MLKKLLLALVFVGFLTVTAFAGVNINTANQQELTSLPGIGGVKAAAIVEYRNLHGSFKTIDELTKIKGIGDRTIENLRDQIVLED